MSQKNVKEERHLMANLVPAMDMSVDSPKAFAVYWSLLKDTSPALQNC